MRVALDKLVERLGVDRVLSAYETQPWLYYDTEKEITCSAEVRMGPGGEDLEAEIQFLRDETDEDDESAKKKDDDEGEEGKGKAGTTTSGGTEQIMLMRALPGRNEEWSPTYLHVKGKDYVNEIHDWEGKGCDFFRACIEAIQMSELPDIDELIERELSDDDGWGGGKRGKVGRKSPTIKPGQLLGIKKGM